MYISPLHGIYTNLGCPMLYTVNPLMFCQMFNLQGLLPDKLGNGRPHGTAIAPKRPQLQTRSTQLGEIEYPKKKLKLSDLSNSF